MCNVQSEVLAWELEPSHLAQRTLRVPQEALRAPLTALACHADGSVFLADEQGNVWQLQVGQGCAYLLVFCCQPSLTRAVKMLNQDVT